MLTGIQRAEWLAARRKGIGGSDAAAILGFSPWRTAMDVWLEKTGLVPERPYDPDKNFLLDLGTRLEPVIAELYERETGNAVVIPARPLFQHPEFSELIGTPDRIGANCFSPDAALAEKFGVELKTENEFTDLFGDPGSDQVPQHYLVQCAHYMAVCNLPRWDVAVLHGGTRFSVYHIYRDAELEGELVSQLRAWWADHVIGRTPPAVDSSDGWRRYLHAMHPVELAPLKQVTEQEAHLVSNLAQVRNAEKNLEALRSETENQIKALIGDAEGVTTPYGRVTWKLTKASARVAWDEAFAELVKKYGIHPEMQTEILARHTEMRHGVRRLLFTPRKNGQQPTISNEQTGNTLPAPATNDATGNGERGIGGASQSAD